VCVATRAAVNAPCRGIGVPLFEFLHAGCSVNDNLSGEFKACSELSTAFYVVFLEIPQGGLFRGVSTEVLFVGTCSCGE